MHFPYRRFPGVFPVFILLALALSACQSPALPSPTPAIEMEAAPLRTTQELVEPTQTAAEAMQVIVNALLALTTQPNRMEVTTLLEDGSTYKNVLEFVPPDSKHILDMTSGMEYIIIGQDVYMKSSSQSLWELTDIPTSTFMGDQPSDAQSIAAGISDVEVLRTDHLQSTAVTIYVYKNTSTVNGIELNSRAWLWVGTFDGLPHLLVVDGEILAASADPTTGETSIQAVPSDSTTIITFLPDLIIEAPISDEDA